MRILQGFGEERRRGVAKVEKISEFKSSKKWLFLTVRYCIQYRGTPPWF
jgi:hypothetical protein